MREVKGRQKVRYLNIYIHTSRISIDISSVRAHFVPPIMSRKMCGTLLRANATFCVALQNALVVGNDLPRSQTP